MQQSRTDFIWYLTTRIGAIAVVVASLAILVSTKEHETISGAQAEAVHRAELASRLRKSTASAHGSLMTAGSARQ